MVIAAQRTSQVTSPTHTQRFQIKHTKKKQKNNKNHQHPQNQFNKILYMNPTKPGIEICRALHREQSHDCSVLLRASSRDSRMVSITRGKSKFKRQNAKKINSGLFLQIAEVAHINCKKQKKQRKEIKTMYEYDRETGELSM